MAEDGGGGPSGALPDMVAQGYYRYGLLVATHPKKVIFLAFTSFLILCTPLWHLPLPGYLPQEYVTSLFNYSVPSPAPEGGIRLDPSPTPVPLWYQGPPHAYILQIVVKSGVVPWHEGLTISDSYRGPLSTVFHLAQTISNYHLHHNESVTLGSECLLIEGVVKKMQSAGQVLPHYNCLMLSPADLWARNLHSFLQDPHVLLTVNSLMASYEGQTNVADILFGVPSREIGFRHSRNPERVITYAATLALKHYNEEFVRGLERELTSRYPLHQPVQPVPEEMTHVYFPSRLSLWEFLLIIFYCVLFVSIYFSILKMDMFKSKLGMAISVQATLIASLCVSVGCCAYFGLRPLHSKGKFVYPVLAGLIGFENSMALMRAVLQTPAHLDTKIRVAQGLAREGWTITKYFLTMITIVTVSFFLFIPLVQEFCIYGSVVLLCDLSTQLIFLTAVLSIDLHRYQESEDQRRPPLVGGPVPSLNPLFRYQPPGPTSGLRILPGSPGPGGTSVPNLHRRTAPSGSSVDCNGQDRVARPQAKPRGPETMPKRLRVAYFLAKKRMFQRMFMCVFVGWIAFMVYSSGLIEHFSEPAENLRHPRDLPSVIFSLTNRSSHLYQQSLPPNPSQTQPPSSLASQPPTPPSSTTNGSAASQDNGLKLLKHRTRSLLRRLPHSHWPTLFSYYNMSISGHYLSFLPPILLSLPITPEEAREVHNPTDPNRGPWMLQHENSEENDGETSWQGESAFVPSSTGELLVTAVMVIPALLVLVYAMVAFYHCVCSRNYAEWRASWWGQEGTWDESSQIIGDALPLVLAGHPYDVECMCTDGQVLVSSCLAGVIRVWDPSTGECLASINRHSQPKPGQREGSPDEGEEIHSDYESGSPRSQSGDCSYMQRASVDNERSFCSCGPLEEEGDSDQEDLDMQEMTRRQSGGLFHAFPDLSPAIDLHFHQSSPATESPGNSPFSHFEKYYLEHHKLLREEDEHRQRRARKISDCGDQAGRCLMGHHTSSTEHLGASRDSRNLSSSSISAFGLLGQVSLEWEELPPIWCLECQNALVLVGCGSGRVEVWDMYSCMLKCVYEDRARAGGVTSMRMSGNRVMVARLSGVVDMLLLEAVTTVTPSGTPTAAPTTSPLHQQHSDSMSAHHHRQPPRPGHSRGGSGSGWTFSYDEPLRLVQYAGVRAHQQPITVMTCDYTRLITGAHDHTLKVHNLFSENLGTRHFSDFGMEDF